MRSTLRAISRVATTVSQTVDVAPRVGASQGVSSFKLSVIPRRTGAMHICGIVLRLFSGAIVMLPAPKVGKGRALTPPIEVMAPLPKLDVSVQAEPCSSDELSATAPIDLFEGEHHRLRVWITNNGSDDIAMAMIRTSADKPDAVRILSEGADSRVQGAVAALERGQSQSFDVQVYAVRPSAASAAAGEAAAARRPRPVALSVEVKYTGRRRSSHIRTTTATLVLHVTPAIFVERLAHVRFHLTDPAAGAVPDELSVAGSPAAARDDGPSAAEMSPAATAAAATRPAAAPALGLVIDVGTRAAAPMQVTVIATDADGRAPAAAVATVAGKTALPPHPRRGDLDAYKTCLVEGGACARLLAPLHVSARHRPDDAEAASSSATGDVAGGFALTWSIPTLGRSGVVPLHVEEVRRVMADTLVSPGREEHALNLTPTSASAFRSLVAAIHIAVGGDVGVAGSAPLARGAPVTTRRYYDLRVDVRNTGSRALPDSSTLDVNVCQSDGRGGLVPVGAGALVGAHEGVACGGLSPGGSFSHTLRLRLASSGVFDVVASVHGQEAMSRTAALDKMLAADGVDARTPAGSHATVSFGAGAPGGVAATAASAHAAPVAPTAAAAAAETAAAAPSPTSRPPEVGTPSQRTASHRTALKRVGLTRRRRGEGQERAVSAHRSALASPHAGTLASSNVVRPFAADGNPEDLAARRSAPPISSERITLQAVNDTRWSSGLLRPLAGPPPDATSAAPGAVASLASPASAHPHRPDTIVR